MDQSMDMMVTFDEQNSCALSAFPSLQMTDAGQGCDSGFAPQVSPPTFQPVTQVAGVLSGKDGYVTDVSDALAQEVRVALVYNGISHTVMMASPEYLEEFAIGFTLSERIVSDISEIKGVELEYVALGVIVQLEITSRRFAELKQQRRNMAGRTGCGLCGVAQLDQAVKPVIPVVGESLFSLGALQQALGQLKAYQPCFAQTGATHGAMALGADGSILAGFEDVGRHIALDKLIGHFAKQKQPMPKAVLLTSRASFEMVQKAAAAGVELLFALSAVTALARELAANSNITLVGFCRDNRAMIYTCPQRIVADGMSSRCDDVNAA